MAEVESLTHSGVHMHNLREMDDFYQNVLGASYTRLHSFATPGGSPATCLMLGGYQLLFRFPERKLPMPPEEQNRGLRGIRHGFGVTQTRFSQTLDHLRQNGIAFEGPVAHPEAGPFGESIYLKDPSGNFLEICWRRDEGHKYNPVIVVGGD